MSVAMRLYSRPLRVGVGCSRINSNEVAATARKLLATTPATVVAAENPVLRTACRLVYPRLSACMWVFISVR